MELSWDRISLDKCVFGRTQLLVSSCTEIYFDIWAGLAAHDAGLTPGVNHWHLLSVVLFGIHFTEFFVVLIE